jgi:hypothetical protein
MAAPNAIQLRPATLSDLSSIAGVWAAAFFDDEIIGEIMHPHRNKYPDDVYWFLLRGIRERFWDWRHQFMVVTNGGKVVGAADWRRLGKGGAKRELWKADPRESKSKIFKLSKDRRPSLQCCPSQVTLSLHFGELTIHYPSPSFQTARPIQPVPPFSTPLSKIPRSTGPAIALSAGICTFVVCTLIAKAKVWASCWRNGVCVKRRKKERMLSLVCCVEKKIKVSMGKQDWACRLAGRRGKEEVLPCSRDEHYSGCIDLLQCYGFAMR